MEKFISVTPAAIEYIKSSVEDGKHLGIRISVSSGGCRGMTYELNFVNEVDLSDVVVEEDGVTIYISSKAVVFVANMQIDYVKNAMGGNIVFENPNAKMRCSCGKSFCTDLPC